MLIIGSNSKDVQINEEIRDKEVRLIGSDGSQLGVMSSKDALKLAEEKELDLVKIAPQATPPVCKIMDYGKYRYDVTKKEKDSKKAQHQVRVKEVKLKPNIDDKLTICHYGSVSKMGLL